jgi:hypothetical protein
LARHQRDTANSYHILLRKYNTTPKRPRDPKQLAKSIIDITTGRKPDRDPTPEEQGKDPAAVALGKEGWKGAGGCMTAKKRSECQKAAGDVGRNKKAKVIRP